jgi:hypothetical protein
MHAMRSWRSRVEEFLGDVLSEFVNLQRARDWPCAFKAEANHVVKFKSGYSLVESPWFS